MSDEGKLEELTIFGQSDAPLTCCSCDDTDKQQNLEKETGTTAAENHHEKFGGKYLSGAFGSG